jgi:hypothetical protein
MPNAVPDPYFAIVTPAIADPINPVNCTEPGISEFREPQLIGL